MIALGRELAGRGHEVTVQTWGRWRPEIEALGMRFAAAPEYHVFPTLDRPLKPYEAVVRATREIQPLVEELAPDAVVADILTLAPALAAERAGVPWATLVPHVYPVGAPGSPPYSFGARFPRTAAGRLGWRALEPFVRAGSSAAAGSSTRRVGAWAWRRSAATTAASPPAVHRRHAARARVPARVAGGRGGGRAAAVRARPPRGRAAPGDAPLVLVAPSTAQDPEHTLLRAALAGLGDAPVRVLATWNRRLPSVPLEVPDNARVVPWVSYTKTMPRCDLVITHAGHGTVVRALTSGTPVLAVPAAAT